MLESQPEQLAVQTARGRQQVTQAIPEKQTEESAGADKDGGRNLRRWRASYDWWT